LFAFLGKFRLLFIVFADYCFLLIIYQICLLKIFFIMFRAYDFTAKQRFLQYVTIDTQSDPNSTAIPSTEKQKNLGRLLVEELLAMGLSDAHLDPFGYVYATLPSNTNKDVPVICFCSHMDTSPDCSGENVKPQLHRNYAGGIIKYPANPDIALDPAEHPDLLMQIGNEIITSDGTTLLGADNKAGVAEIMDAVHFLLKHPEVKHGTIKILFTPDEEIGRGVNKVDLQSLHIPLMVNLWVRWKTKLFLPMV
jgi:tripeptide aminopeptidase